MMRFFAWKMPTLCTALLVVAVVFLSSGHAASAATTHGSSVASHMVIQPGKAVVHPNDTLDGCPLYDGCIIGANGSDMEMDTYYTYGVHPFYNEFGQHLVVNNQSGPVGENFYLTLCYHADGTDCDYMLRAGESGYVNLDAYNSLVLSESSVGS